MKKLIMALTVLLAAGSLADPAWADEPALSTVVFYVH